MCEHDAHPGGPGTRRTKMVKYNVNIEVVRSYVVEVEAASPQDAVAKVEAMGTDELGLNVDLNEYLDTQVLVDGEPDLAEETP